MLIAEFYINSFMCICKDIHNKYIKPHLRTMPYVVEVGVTTLEWMVIAAIMLGVIAVCWKILGDALTVLANNEASFIKGGGQTPWPGPHMFSFNS